MGEFVSVIFCRNCGSRFVEISEWDDKQSIIHCRTCNVTEKSEKFTLGRCEVKKSELFNARQSMAKKGRYEK